MKSWLFILIVASACLADIGYGSDQETTIFFRDARNYLETIEKAKEVKLKDQLEIWKNFLEQYPDSNFRVEIDHNLMQLEKILGVATESSKELSDTQIYFKAKKFIANKNLSIQDEQLLWKQFLGDHPNNAHKNEVKQRLQEIHFTLMKKPK